MSNRAEYLALQRLKNNPDYKILEARWLEIISDIETQRDKVAAKASEGNWKYFAGQEKGAKRITMALVVAILELEAQDEELIQEAKYEALMREVTGKGETK